ncbi:hypothetical protein ACFSN5_05665 [Streptococcus tangpeifui]|uniref:hypothetical protein n=1 Tax=Streptococcus tangpeifui TaxID=2709400 RepID=UPI0013EE34F7|nr:MULTISPECIES: hypothetical protein [unclassified Streptococcus]
MRNIWEFLNGVLGPYNWDRHAINVLGSSNPSSSGAYSAGFLIAVILFVLVAAYFLKLVVIAPEWEESTAKSKKKTAKQLKKSLTEKFFSENFLFYCFLMGMIFCFWLYPSIRSYQAHRYFTDKRNQVTDFKFMSVTDYQADNGGRYSDPSIYLDLKGYPNGKNYSVFVSDANSTQVAKVRNTGKNQLVIVGLNKSGKPVHIWFTERKATNEAIIEIG